MKRKPIPILKNVTISGFSSDGNAIAKVDGLVVFVPFVVPGDIIDIQIVARKKNYLEGKAIFFHKYSETREKPFCKHFGICGGCKWQHIPYEEQLIFKQNQVVEQFQRIGKTVLDNQHDIVASDKTQEYRNKLEFTFSQLGWFVEDNIDTENTEKNLALGFHIPKRFDRVLDIEKCYLQSEPTNLIRNTIKKISIENNFSFFNHRTNEGLLRNVILRNNSENEFLIILVLNEENLSAINLIFSELESSFKQIISFYYVVNNKLNDSISDLEPKLWSGQKYLTEKISNPILDKTDLLFQIAPLSFFQTNIYQTKKLYKKSFDLAELKGDEIVYDLYCGTGTISLFFAQKSKKVVGIEYVDMAIEDAKINAQLNNIENAFFFAGDIVNVLNDEFLNKNGYPDIIVTDPPRAGMHENVVKQILKIGAKKIVYISCNAATQARDISLLSEKYIPVYSQAFDMFPHTHHIENVVLLVLK